MDVMDLVKSVLDACEPGRLVRAGWPANLDSAHVVAIGKASGAMAKAALELLGDGCRGGVVLGPEGTLGDLPGLDVHPVDHPLATERNVNAAAAVETLARSLGPSDTMLVLLSGGASAHLTSPIVSLDALRDMTDQLLRAGATIDELNTVRKHVERLKGGRLADMSPANVTALVLSDVVGDRPDIIGSGPVTPDPTTFADAIGVLDRRGASNDEVRSHLSRGVAGEVDETPKVLHGVRYQIIGSRRTAVEAARAWLLKHGFQVRGIEADVTGEAAAVGRALAHRVRGAAQGSAWIIAGETTVSAVDKGAMGGPALELALAAAIKLEGGPAASLVSFATDGIDGPTEAAGAWVDAETCARLRKLADPEALLAAHQSRAALLDHLIVTGPTGTNVNDVAVLMVE